MEGTLVDTYMVMRSQGKVQDMSRNPKKTKKVSWEDKKEVQEEVICLIVEV